MHTDRPTRTDTVLALSSMRKECKVRPTPMPNQVLVAVRLPFCTRR